MCTQRPTIARQSLNTSPPCPRNIHLGIPHTKWTPNNAHSNYNTQGPGTPARWQLQASWKPHSTTRPSAATRHDTRTELLIKYPTGPRKLKEQDPPRRLHGTPSRRLLVSPSHRLLEPPSPRITIASSPRAAFASSPRAAFVSSPRTAFASSPRHHLLFSHQRTRGIPPAADIFISDTLRSPWSLACSTQA